MDFYSKQLVNQYIHSSHETLDMELTHIIDTSNSIIANITRSSGNDTVTDNIARSLEYTQTVLRVNITASYPGGGEAVMLKAGAPSVRTPCQHQSQVFSITASSLQVLANKDTVPLRLTLIFSLLEVCTYFVCMCVCTALHAHVCVCVRV